MMNYPNLILLLTLLLISCSMQNKNEVSVHSPNKQIKLSFFLSPDGKPQYQVSYNNNTVIDTSALGFEFKQLPPFEDNLTVENIKRDHHSSTWKPVWGQQSIISDNYSELLVTLKEKEKPDRTAKLHVKVFNDGLGFRFEFPGQKALPDSIFITNEKTEFALTADHTAWWIPADYDSYEYNYKQTKVSQIDASDFKDQNKRPDRQIDNFHAVNTPLTLKTAHGTYLSFHEAALTDYPGMTLAVKDSLTLGSELVPWPDGVKVRTKAPFHTPWRTIQIGDSPADLAESTMILNLNKPQKIKNTSWIQPMKYTGIWWEMHLGKSSWSMDKADEDSYGNQKNSPHGATTENALKYIDFTSRAKIKGMLIEGWNTGWKYWGTDSVGFFDFTTPYPDLDLKKVVKYARKKNVNIIGHHETSGQAAHYEKRLKPAFQLYQKLGIHAVKTGYAGGIIPKGQYHHGQYMVRHYRKVVETAAKYHIMVDAHEPIKPTGIRRTWPNMMTREGVRGMEYNAWSEGNPPEHTTILPFTRVLGGPVDYTPGIFDITFDKYRKKEQVHSTIANQLALYVVLYSPLQMVADMPENYLTADNKLHPLFKFIQDVPVDWDSSKVVDARIGDYVITARKEKNSKNWFLGAVTDENKRELKVPLTFLNDSTTYKATLYEDGRDAHWKNNPTSYKIKTKDVTRDGTLELKLAPGGGTAISFIAKN